jgi:TatD DNase family protein
MFIDTHCHLNHEQFAGDITGAIERAESAGVVRMIVVGFDVSSSEEAVRLAESHPALYAAVAVHPHDSRHYDSAAEDQIRQLADSHKVVAIGEIGLDFHYDFSSREDQYRAFRAQLELASELQFPVIIHCREAYPETLEVLEERLNRESSGAMHCWAGNVDEAGRTVALGMFLGFGGVITFKNADSARESLQSTPLDRILLETDAPYLAPVPYRGKRNEPSYIPLIAQHAATELGVDLADLARVTSESALRLFSRIPPP